MSEINLLPQESKPKGYALNASKSLKKLSIVSIILLLLTVTVVVSVNVFFSIQARSMSSKEESLKKEIKALEDTEQKLVLIENRLTGIERILSENSSKEQIEMLQRVIEKNPTDIIILGATLDPKKVILRVGTDDSKKLTSFYRLLAGLNFNSIDLDSFNYDNKGYEVGIAIR